MAGKLTAVIITALLVAGVALFLDFDGDGLSNVQELQTDTSGIQFDSDGDGIGDGREVQLGLPPTINDWDGDGVPDGDEGAMICTVRRDCDGDGLPDGQEAPDYDALDPDTYDVGLSDGIVEAFAAAGQPASPDEDNDGIPDGWELDEGLISWGPFTPQPGRPDFLVEYIRVEGPNSGRFNLDFAPAYDAVSEMFGAQGIHLQWHETVFDTSVEVRPGFLDTDDIGYYDAALGAGTASLNPFVTTVILNPQQTQADLAGDILGAAFLRSMIATVDYGAHAHITFEEARSDGLTLNGNTITLEPVLESHIIGARPEQARGLQFASEGIVELCTAPCADEFWFVTRQSQPGDDLFLRWTWEPDWFVTSPNITLATGEYLQTRLVEATLDTDQLAGTIAHELGHTLGLCHAHEAECYGEFDPSEINQASIDSTTMSYTAPQGTLNFLATEWAQVRQYLVCPPQEPVVLVAMGAPAAVLRDSKYLSSFTEAIDLRECGDAASIPRNLEPSTADADAGGAWLAGYIAAGLGIVALAWWRA